MPSDRFLMLLKKVPKTSENKKKIAKFAVTKSSFIRNKKVIKVSLEGVQITFGNISRRNLSSWRNSYVE